MVICASRCFVSTVWHEPCIPAGGIGLAAARRPGPSTATAREVPKMSRRGNRLIYWTPRVLCILFALFISMFALDVFDGARGFWGTLVALGMHMVPTAVVVLVTILAWRWEWIGTLAFFTTGVLYSVSTTQHPDWILVIAGPQFVIGALFLLSWFQRRRVRSAV
jgi:hypothetical protein